MRNIDSNTITDTVYRLSLKANIYLRKELKRNLDKAVRNETDSLSKRMLKKLIENYNIAEDKSLPICQDTGMVVVFVEIGKDIKLNFSRLEHDINTGVKRAYQEGFFRKSVVNDPILRKNTKDNLPAIIHYDFVKNKGLKISILIKGFGAENKSKLCMLDPTATSEDIIDYIVNVVKNAGPDACPPYVLGIGIGGTMDKAALISKKALLENINIPNRNPHIAKLEKRIKKKVNSLKIGVMGLGGKYTCLGVNILTYPTHIAGLPVAVNINCHALRSASTTVP